MQAFSYIDYIMVSNKVIEQVQDFDIIDCALNLSDHNPILIKMFLEFDVINRINEQESTTNNESIKHCTWRWDHGNTDTYYTITHTLLEPIHEKITELYNNYVSSTSVECHDVYTNYNLNGCLNDNVSITHMVEKLYNQLIISLNQAAMSTIPMRKTNFFKYWWDEGLEILKGESISTHQTWNENGRPNQGPIYELKRKAKLKYKSLIKKRANLEKSVISNSLHDALLYKEKKHLLENI